MSAKRLLYINLIFFTLAACAPLLTSTPPPTPQPLLIQRPLSLQGWDDRLRSCAMDFPQIALYIDEQAPSSTISGSLTLEMLLGEPSQSNGEVFLLGTENLLMAANIDFPVGELSLPQLRDIYNGQIATSQSITPNAEEFLLQAWTYPTGDEARQVFNQVTLLKQVHAFIVPDPQAMLEALASQPGAIGYLPASAWAAAGETQKAKIKELKLKEAPPDAFIRPVLFSLPTEPSDLLNAYLLCLQK